jgi:hypothetical protein
MQDQTLTSGSWRQRRGLKTSPGSALARVSVSASPRGRHLDDYLNFIRAMPHSTSCPKRAGRSARAVLLSANTWFKNSVNFQEESIMWYASRFYLSLIAGAILVAGALVAPNTGQAKGMDINDLSDGGFEVRFDNGCLVAYDKYGERGEYTQNCKNSQLEKADEAARSRQGSQSSSSANQGNSGAVGSAIPSAATQKCRERFGGPTEITRVNPLRPGYWEVIMQGKDSPRTVACTVSSSGEIENWVEMN